MPSLRHVLPASGAFAAAVLVAQPAVAQAPVEQLQRELTALRAELQQLREQVNALTAQVPGPAPAAPALEMVQTQVAELAQTRVESTTRLPVKVFGTVHAGVFTNSANANWLGRSECGGTARRLRRGI